MKKLSLCLFFLLQLFSSTVCWAQTTTRAIVAKVGYMPDLCSAQYVVINTPGKEATRILELKYYAREMVMDVRRIVDSTHTSIEKDNAYLVFRDQLNIQEVETWIAVLKKLVRQSPDLKFKVLYQHETIHPITEHLAVNAIQKNNQLNFALELYRTQIQLRKNWMEEMIQSLEEGLQQLKAWQE
jgi:hypothetical protein